MDPRHSMCVLDAQDGEKILEVLRIEAKYVHNLAAEGFVVQHCLESNRVDGFATVGIHVCENHLQKLCCMIRFFLGFYCILFVMMLARDLDHVFTHHRCERCQDHPIRDHEEDDEKETRHGSRFQDRIYRLHVGIHHLEKQEQGLGHPGEHAQLALLEDRVREAGETMAHQSCRHEREDVENDKCEDEHPLYALHGLHDSLEQLVQRLHFPEHPGEPENPQEPEHPQKLDNVRQTAGCFLLAANEGAYDLVERHRPLLHDGRNDDDEVAAVPEPLRRMREEVQLMLLQLDCKLEDVNTQHRILEPAPALPRNVELHPHADSVQSDHAHDEGLKPVALDPGQVDHQEVSADLDDSHEAEDPQHPHHANELGVAVALNMMVRASSEMPQQAHDGQGPLVDHATHNDAQVQPIPPNNAQLTQQVHLTMVAKFKANLSQVPCQKALVDAPKAISHLGVLHLYDHGREVDTENDDAKECVDRRVHPFEVCRARWCDGTSGLQVQQRLSLARLDFELDAPKLVEETLTSPSPNAVQLVDLPLQSPFSNLGLEQLQPLGPQQVLILVVGLVL
mmetsp:Transcript_54550/g.152149  ORF Transcript_54550/g.152149 Transcript_54550/m.152149 type:complete len:565 (-) Transcript_54550:114-1808(-)